MIFRRRSGVAAVAALISACSGAQKQPEGGCTKDTDCRNPRICEANVCIDPHALAASRDGGAPVTNPHPVKGSAPFAMFGGDARHTGKRGGPAPASAPKELWSTDVKGVVAGSPTIGPDGTIYVTSHEGSLFAIDAAGKIK